jgi:hypothetical protein
MADYIGRKVAVGLGKETVRGTAVAPAFFVRHLSLDFKRKGESVQNESALNRREKFSDSEVVKEWAEGKLEGKVNHKSFGLILLGAFGDVDSAANGDGYDHTFTLDQSNTPQSLTLARKDPITSRRHALAMIKSLEVTIEAGEYVKFSCDIVAKNGVASSETVAYVEEYEFTSKHAFVRFADELADVDAAPNSAVKSGKITIDLGVEAYFEVGQIAPSEIHAMAVEVTGEVVARHSNGDYEDMYYENTRKAMQIGAVNTDVDLGGGLNPGFVFTLPQVKITDYDTSNDLDAIVEQTMGITGELSLTEGYAVQAVLTNDVASY